MLFDRARLTHARWTPESQGLRGLISVLLSVVITFSVACILGGPNVQAHAEAERHDSVSVDGGTPSTWFRRGGDSRINKCAVGLDCEPRVEDDFDFLEAVVRPTDEPPPLESVIAFSTQRRQAAPVRGPPCACDRV